MAFPSSVLLVALIIAIATPLSHGSLIIGGTPIAKLVVKGKLYCSATGNALAGATGLAGVPLSLVPSLGLPALGSFTTVVDGSFEIDVNIGLVNVDIDIAACLVVVTLPCTGCAALPSSGLLKATLVLKGVSLTLAGAVAEFEVAAFVHV